MKLEAKLCVGLLTLLIVITGSFADSMAKCPVRMGSLYPSDHFSVISQRGSTSKFPENTLPAFQEALDVDGANSLAIDLSITRDGKIVLWQDWDLDRSRKNNFPTRFEKFKPIDPHFSKSGKRNEISKLNYVEFTDHYGYENGITHEKLHIKIPTLHDFMKWATQQSKLKLVLFKIKIPADENLLASKMFQEIRRTMKTISPAPHFRFVLLTPHLEILSRIRNSFKELSFSFDREIPSAKIINYHAYTTVPNAMEFKNQTASIGFPVQSQASDSSTPNLWDIYKFILTLDFKIRDNYKRSTSNYIKIISWTFNDEKKIRCLIHLGVDGIVTNDPKLVRKIALNLGKILD